MVVRMETTIDGKGCLSVRPNCWTAAVRIVTEGTLSTDCTAAVTREYVPHCGKGKGVIGVMRWLPPAAIAYTEGRNERSSLGEGDEAFSLLPCAGRGREQSAAALSGLPRSPPTSPYIPFEDSLGEWPVGAAHWRGAARRHEHAFLGLTLLLIGLVTLREDTLTTVHSNLVPRPEFQRRKPVPVPLTR